MKIYRESLLLWLAFGGALVAFLVTAEAPPTEWSYVQWLQFAVFVFGWFIGKLQHSYLSGDPAKKPEEEQPTIIRK